MDNYCQIPTSIIPIYILYVFYIGFWILLCLIISKSIQHLCLAFISVFYLPLTLYFLGHRALMGQVLTGSDHVHMHAIDPTSNKSPPQYMVEGWPPGIASILNTWIKGRQEVQSCSPNLLWHCQWGWECPSPPPWDATVCAGPVPSSYLYSDPHKE